MIIADFTLDKKFFFPLTRNCKPFGYPFIV